MKGNEDSGVYKISDDTALVQSVDFITPVVDDPFIFGQISAANSMSDIWAMGGKVINALNVVGYDKINLNMDLLKEMFRGAAKMVADSGAVTLGGHTIENMEMFFGLSVTGLIHPDKIVRNNSGNSGDVLILTKPLGIGSLTTGIKRKLLNADLEKQVIDTMLMTNKIASEMMIEAGATACTDVTGYGLLGHACEMAAENKSLKMNIKNIPSLPDSLQYISKGVFPGGCRTNFDYYTKFSTFSSSVSEAEKYLMSDPQTSGGLLISIPPDKAESLLNSLKNAGYKDASIIGEVIPREKKALIIE